ncbi:hypothetical protein EV702DRAFT_1203055 [Suillus placidus]|uniref:Uncharacterized protein n=1 Tax=Suillus placidus TaxID=48579 RepID=A0A9P6ZKJ3_9AGAM|nr:hypothetical protein EV702DRAFT_1203055 [Suillus placidus]
MSHKRKYRKVAPTANLVASATIITPDLLTLSIQAYEATIIRGPQSLSTALSLEAPHLPTLGVDASDPQIGNALIQWGASTRNFQLLNSDSSFPEASGDKATWVDRYDARLLLDAVTEHASPSISQPRLLSPTGWSDLPSDTEDTFFFTPHEIEDYRREKRRRLIDRNREDRLRALAKTDESEQLDLWGGSDEEPDNIQSELMKRTALHLLSSPNPAQLEMRILANHGADKRFAFLRGRWSRAWRMTKERLRQEKVDQSAQSLRASRNVGLGGLAAYGDSDNEGSEEDSESGETSPLKVGESSATALDSLENRNVRLEEAEQEARRARAREWAAQRRARQGQTSSTDEDRAHSSDS